MNKKKIKLMHVADLYENILAGDRESLDELISRQQSGRSLRFYPEGRSGPEDEGMIPIVIDVCDSSVCIRSGRPSRAVVIDKHVALKWIAGIPQCLSSVVSNYRMDGVDEEKIEERIIKKATKGFGHEVSYELESDAVTVQFFPHGESSWKMNTQDCCNLIKTLCDVCIEKNWKYTDAVSRNQARVVAAMYKKGE